MKIPKTVILSGLLILISFQNFSRPLTFDIYISATGGTDANWGEAYTQSIRTLDRAQEILRIKNPQQPVRILVGRGDYYCRGLQETWTYSNGRTISIEALNLVPSPAVSSSDDLRRPIFYGVDQQGNPCEKSVWFDLAHEGNAMNLSIQGLKVQQYRGGITIRHSQNKPPVSSQDIRIDNMVFERIGDFYYSSSTVGKGAVLVSYTSGVSILNSQFDQIRNNETSSGLIHSVYFSSRVTNSLIENNNFHGNSGSVIKLTHFSNGNTIRNNRFSYAPTSIVDRWCGAVKTDDIIHECAGGVPQCPSWNNDFSQGNISTNLDFDKEAMIYPIPKDQDCGLAPPSAIRMRLKDRVIY